MFNKICHVVGVVAIVVGGVATAGALPAVVIPIAGGVSTLAAYLANNPFGKDPAADIADAAKIAEVAKDTADKVKAAGKSLAVLALALGIASVSCAGSGAEVKAGAKNIADICKPELLPDVVNALPQLAAFTVCEAKTPGKCDAEKAALDAIATADVKACWSAELAAAHAQ